MKKPDEGKLIELTDELNKVKEQLDQKSILLDKVKVLLHRAAAKEKSLLQEVNKNNLSYIELIITQFNFFRYQS